MPLATLDFRPGDKKLTKRRDWERLTGSSWGQSQKAAKIYSHVPGGTVTSIQLASGLWWPLQDWGAATHSCCMTGQRITGICQSRWSQGPGAQDGLFQAPGGVGDVRDDQGLMRRKGSPFIRRARPDGIRFPTKFTGWLHRICRSTTDKLKLQASHFPSLSLRHSEIKFHWKNPVSLRGAQRGFRDFKGRGDVSFLKLGAGYVGIYCIITFYN